jgi:hypothetical protein
VIVDVSAWGLAAFSGLIVAIPTWFFARSSEKRKAEDRISALETQLALITQTVTPISVAFQQILVKQLTKPHAPILDEILSRIQDLGLNLEDQERLAELLAERVEEVDISEHEADAARMLPMMMRRIRHEASVAPPRMMVPIMVSVPGDQLPELGGKE